GPARLLLLVPHRQFRVGTRVRTAVRPGPRRLRHAGPYAEGELPLVPRVSGPYRGGPLAAHAVGALGAPRDHGRLRRPGDGNCPRFRCCPGFGKALTSDLGRLLSSSDGERPRFAGWPWAAGWPLMAG